VKNEDCHGDRQRPHQEVFRAIFQSNFNPDRNCWLLVWNDNLQGAATYSLDHILKIIIIAGYLFYDCLDLLKIDHFLMLNRVPAGKKPTCMLLSLRFSPLEIAL